MSTATRIRNRLRLILGTVAGRLMPHLVREAETGARGGRSMRVKRWILYARTRAALLYGSEAEVSRALANQWRSDSANRFYDKYPARFREWFLGPHQAVVDEMVKLEAEAPFRRLVEIGCGDGRVLAHCAERMPRIPDCVGIDINRAIIARNRESFAADPRLRFVAANAEPWLDRNAGPGTLLFSYGGVLEYLDRDSVARILRRLAGQPGSAVALVEPVAPDHDLAQNPGSYNFGPERSFSHNHAALAAEAGFALRFQAEIQLGGARWVMLLTQVSGGGVPGA